MPSKNDHKRQFNHNKNLINEDFFDLNNTVYLDWVVTIIFYTVMHLIEDKLADNNIHCNSHTSRFKAVNRFTIFNSISNEYQTVYMESQKARYDCLNITKKQANEILNLLNYIEKELSKD